MQKLNAAEANPSTKFVGQWMLDVGCWMLTILVLGLV
jgi:hypothetical protein